MEVHMGSIEGFEGLYSVTKDARVFSHRTGLFLQQSLLGIGCRKLARIHNVSKSCIDHILANKTYANN